MKSVSTKSLISGVLYAGMLLAAVFGATAHAEAAAMTASCTVAPTIENFTPYIYEDGDLHSFDYTVVGDGAPTVVATTVGGQSLEGFYSTTWQTETANSKKIHVDVPSWYGLTGETLISVSVMTADGAGCTVQKEFVVQLPTHAKGPISSGTSPVAHAPGQTEPAPEESIEVSNDEAPGTYAKGAWAGLLGSFTSMFGGTSADEQCVSWPKGTWIFLAILCVVAVLVIVDSLPYLLSGNGVRFAVVLLLVFLVLLALWFVFDRCRENRWFPVAVTLLTLGTLIMPTALDGKKGRAKKFPF